MIHIIESDRVYYNSFNRILYFRNDKSQTNFPVAEVSELVEYDGGLLSPNSFSVFKKKKSKKWIVEPDENLSPKCFYFGEFCEDNCVDIKADFKATNCKVVANFSQNIKDRYTMMFVAILSSRTFICFDIELQSGEKFKKLYTYDPKLKKVIHKKINTKNWDIFVGEIILDDYDESIIPVEVNFDMLDLYKNSRFVFKK